MVKNSKKVDSDLKFPLLHCSLGQKHKVSVSAAMVYQPRQPGEKPAALLSQKSQLIRARQNSKSTNVKSEMANSFQERKRQKCLDHEEIDVKKCQLGFKNSKQCPSSQQLQVLVADGNPEIWTADEDAISSIICHRRFDIEKSLV